MASNLALLFCYICLMNLAISLFIAFSRKGWGISGPAASPGSEFEAADIIILVVRALWVY
jgi:hypothetical protein